MSETYQNELDLLKMGLADRKWMGPTENGWAYQKKVEPTGNTVG